MKTKLQENLQGITTKRPSENFVKTQLMQLVISPTVPPNSFLTEFDYSSKTLVSLGLLNPNAMNNWMVTFISMRAVNN